MTIGNNFPIGYFYIISNLNGLVIDVEDPENAKIGSKIIMSQKKPESPERDSQLFIHQNGFLTNKLTGHVLDIDRAGTFMAIFTGDQHLFLDGMKEAENADDQRFGYDKEHGFIYTLSDPNVVFDIKGSKDEERGRVMVYKRKDLSEAKNQLWTVEPSDPPREPDSDDSSDEEDVGDRISAFFGNFSGWGRHKNEALDERALERAAEKVEKKKKKKSKMSYNLMAGAAAFAAVKAWEHRQEENGEEMEHSTAKKAIAVFAAAEIAKLIQERGGDDEDEEEEKKEKKKGLMEKMATAAAINYFEKKYT